MGINSILSKILLDNKDTFKYSGNLITLGRQELDVRSESLRKEYSDLIKITDSTEIEVFFRALGFDHCDSLDYSSKDGCTVLHDLNTPLPDSLRNKYDFVFDAGTMEHIYDVASVMKNMYHLLKPNGTVIHINPSLGYSNHGFYNLQPTFYYSFYRANNFKIINCCLIEYLDKDRNSARVTPIENYNNLKFRTLNDTLILFVAIKPSDSVSYKVPIQEFYYKIYKEKNKVNGGMIENAKYREIVGDVKENNYEYIMKNSYIIEV